MESKKKKRPLETVTSSEEKTCSIVVSEKHLDERKGFISILKTINAFQSSAAWVSFIPEGKWIPIVISNNSDRAIRPIVTSVIETLEFQPEDSSQDVKTHAVINKKPIRNIYWFSPSTPSEAGKLTITFSCPDLPEVIPAVFQVDVLPPVAEVEKSSKSKPLKQESSKQEAHHDIAPEKIVKLLHRVPEELELRLSPPSLNLVLPATLVAALLDDRATAAGGKATTDLIHSPRQPSVRELLTHVRSKYGSRIKGSADAVESLLASFESLCVDSLLYPAEKAMLEETGVLSRLREERRPFSDWFGAPHLLRLVVAVVSALAPGPDSTLGRVVPTSLVVDTASDVEPIEQGTSSFEGVGDSPRLSPRHATHLVHTLSAIIKSLTADAHTLF